MAGDSEFTKGQPSINFLVDIDLLFWCLEHMFRSISNYRKKGINTYVYFFVE